MKTSEIKIGDALKEFVKTKPVSKGYRQKEIESFWNNKMGSMINSYTSRIKLIKNTLFISLSSSALRQELSMEKNKIKELISKELGDDFIEEIVLQ